MSVMGQDPVILKDADGRTRVIPMQNFFAEITGPRFRLLGMTVDQIVKMRAEWMQLTSKRPEDL